ncbi:MAG TPA: hypothetical protein VFQ25_00295 [Ktedonobacterales bacterium]|nr:hypothetical protein [Ktedonobacterales bacterium]
MAVWEFSPEDLLFPIAVVALWGAIFLLIVYVSRFAAHEHDGEAEEQEAAVQDTLSHSYASETPPLPA